ncbi:MAG TPA: RNA polymerase sigma factor [Deltaproteobacteria bacterium]|nr:RNA polymerase sigma factor [Deltaproteobacteria bacterium]
MLPAEPRAKLLERALAGDRDALGALAEAHWPMMRRIAYAELGDPAGAEDAVQEALIRLIRFIHTYDPARPFGAWLRTLVRNAAREARGAGVRRTRREQAAIGPWPQVTHADPGRRMDLQRKAGDAFSAFCALPVRQRQLVELVDRRGLSPTEAAAELGIAPGSARSQLFAARRALRSHLLQDSGEIVELLRES